MKMNKTILDRWCSMFWRKEAPKRSIDDILTPKEDMESKDAVEVEELEDIVQEKESNRDAEFNNEPIRPFDCFGIEEAKTEKWLGKCVKFWFCCMSFLWFLFGAFTFAPVIFIGNKVNVIFKDKKKSLFVAIGIYSFIVAIVVLFSITDNIASP
jgi:hypothetical protein